MKDDVVIEVHGLCKKFCSSLKRSLTYGALDIAFDLVGISSGRETLRPGEFWALNDISFELRRGETLGILGLNGAGKSTLLRLISGIFPPDSGQIQVRGKLGSLIALGAGFHPHMTGRENIFVNGTMLGMSSSEIASKMDSIVEFSELEAFLDSPISTYSSGMVVRLGFSIAIHCDLDVMLIDEVISVGDLPFQNKCLRKIFEKKQQGTSFVFVSHGIETMRMVCDRGIFLSKGKIESVGPIDEVLMRYNSLVRHVRKKSFQRELGQSSPNSDLQVFESGVIGSFGEEIEAVTFGEDFRIFWEFALRQEAIRPFAKVVLRGERMGNIFCEGMDLSELDGGRLEAGKKYRLELLIKNPNVSPGVYSFSMEIVSRESTFASTERAFVIDGNRFSMNAIGEVPAQWFFASEDQESGSPHEVL